jgi:monosaccharide-transporting ATPase
VPPAPPRSGQCRASSKPLETEPLLALRGITKRFPGVRALGEVDFTLRAGEIHALLGENGAGKSTLIKVLTGVYPADAGTITLDGEEIAPTSPKEAEHAGISTVYQEVNLIPALSVAENITLGRQPGRCGFIRWGAMRLHARQALARLELDCDVDAELGSLSVALQQMVAIARALDLQARILVLDEPTASLDEKEVAELFKVMRRLRGEGLGIVFVTHFLDQVYAVSDRLTVLRNGLLVGEYLTAEIPRLPLVSQMLGRDVADETGRSAAPSAAGAGAIRRWAEASPRAGGSAPTAGAPGALLTVRGLQRRGAVQGIDFTLGRGEVFGLAGLLGSGRTETARLLFGIDRADGGEVRLRDQPVRVDSPRDAVRLGLAFCSEDRKTEGILPNLSVRENLIFALQAKRGVWRTLARAEQESLCAHYIAALRIKTADAETPIRNLSGGNQQKVLLARWLATQPELIILDEPTRGIDVGAKAEIEQLISRLRADGLSVLLISSEIEEIVRNCGRVLVLRERRAAGEVAGEEISQERLMRLMAGQP